MLKKLPALRVFFLLASVFTLCQCAKTVNSSQPNLRINAPLASPYSQSAAAYLTQAATQEGSKQQHLLLLAAGKMIADGQWRQGSAILAQTGELTEMQTYEKKVLQAKIELLRDKPQAALDELAAVKQPEILPVFYQSQLHETKAQAWRLTGKPIASISERIALEHLPGDRNSQMHNQRALWLTLINIPTEQLHTLSAEEADKSELQGWLQLAIVSRKYRDNSKSLLAALDQWQSAFENHPANQILPNPLDSIADKIVAKPKKIALLVPLSGALSGPGNAVRDGFTAALKANKSENETQIVAYDTEKGEVSATYQQAIQEGADYVVGPLTKNHVATIAALPHPVPTLLLNDSEAGLQDNSYRFGLSPTEEAMQVATKAQNKGYRHALVIAPDNAWGQEITRAFTRQWRKKGGQITDTLSYNEKDDLNKKVQSLLQIPQSQTREKRIKELLGQQIQVFTGRRQDFDMIFLLAYPTKARQIMPLLKYYYAGDVPVFATSSVYSGSANALKDRDLEGVIFCDIPWVFSHQMGNKNWPEQFNSYNRLYALGKDSYTLATQLNHLILFPADDAGEANGVLYLKASQQVARVLEWGQFKQGLAHSLGDTV